ncbi:hypothetical protein L210DRAFT_230366 [Boletus edulis BED1]|uniref:Uncharacterized protein n=1 Tax=Boletus edulis BED1 TaxID=1328754 RepID=A0AAD4BFB9_BOLED|nr:hypothetical protein L210DRAFT_230366 [Boletus edulis BED1]
MTLSEIRCRLLYRRPESSKATQQIRPGRLRGRGSFTRRALRASCVSFRLFLIPSLFLDKTKQKLVEILREIGFKLSNGRLQWSTLDADLWKKRYMIINWLHGVVRDRDKGVSGLSAEDTDRLHDALFVDERRIQFVPCGEESASNNDQVASSSVASNSDRACENKLSMIGKQPRFRATFIEHPRPQKRRRILDMALCAS